MTKPIHRLNEEIKRYFAALVGLARIEGLNILKISSRSLIGAGVMAGLVFLSLAWASVWLGFVFSDLWGWNAAAALVALIFVALAATAYVVAVNIAKSKILKKDDRSLRSPSEAVPLGVAASAAPAYSIMGAVNGERSDFRDDDYWLEEVPDDRSADEQRYYYIQEMERARSGLSLAAEDLKNNAVHAMNPLPPVKAEIRKHPGAFMIGGAAVGVLLGLRNQGNRRMVH
jgi:hypothetical protein